MTTRDEAAAVAAAAGSGETALAAALRRAERAEAELAQARAQVAELRHEVERHRLWHQRDTEAMLALRRELRCCAQQLAALGRTGSPDGSVARALAQADAALSPSPPSGERCQRIARGQGLPCLVDLAVMQGEEAACAACAPHLAPASGGLSPEAAERIAEGMRTLRDQREPHDDGQGGDVEQDPDCWCARCVAVRTLALLEGRAP